MLIVSQYNYIMLLSNTLLVVKALAFELSRSSKAIARSVGQFYLLQVHRG